MPTDIFNRTGAPPVQQYIGQICDYVEANSIQPPELRARFARDLTTVTKNAQTFKETYPAIREALANLGDNHSFLCPKEWWTDAGEADHRMPSGHMIGDVAYLKIPGCLGNQNRAIEYATHCQSLIRSLDQHSPRSWVLDLRDNDGGNCWPMLAGVGPLFEHQTENDDGLLGHFVMRNGRESFGYSNGIAWNEENGERGSCLPLPEEAYHLKTPSTPVAVLAGPKTSSAGETVAVAAHGLKPRVKVFGADTAGQATGNGPVTGLIDDGANIFLAVSSYADRTGRPYGHSLPPDQYTANSGPDDPVPSEALQWLEDQTHAPLLAKALSIQP